MAGKKKTTDDAVLDEGTEKLVKEALLRIAAAETDTSLQLKPSKGGSPAVFEPATGANGKALKRIGDASLATQGGTKKEPRVALTKAGFAMVAGDIPAEKVAAIAKVIIEALPAGEQVKCILDWQEKTPVLAKELEPLLKEAEHREKEEGERSIAAVKREAERFEASQAALERAKQLLEQRKLRQREEYWRMYMAMGGEKTGANTSGDFHREMGERLVASWSSADKSEKKDARDYLETLIENLDWMIRIGEEGETVPFDSKIHADIPGLSTGHKVRVTRSGWALEVDEHRQHVIEKALVAK